MAWRCGNMNGFYVKILLYTTVISKYLPVIHRDERHRWMEYCRDDYKKCPNCFDDTDNCCAFFLDNVLMENSFESEMSSLFGNRKIQFGTDVERGNIVLKHLVSDENLDNLKRKFCDEKSNCESHWTNPSPMESLKTELLRIFVTKESVAGFQICPTDSVTRFMEVFSQQSIFAWVLLNINVEPLIVQTLSRRHFPVPQLYDSCGFVTIHTDNGLPLYTFYDQSFAVRLLIAKNLIDAALQFSYGVDGFR